MEYADTRKQGIQSNHANKHAKPINLKQVDSISRVLRKGKGSGKADVSKNHDSVAQTGGVNLPTSLLDRFEPAFNENFSGVKIYRDSQKAKQFNSLAFTNGEHIHFAPDQYHPDTKSGQQLIGHELTHVSQQRKSAVRATSNKQGDNINTSTVLENEADRMGTLIAEGRTGAQQQGNSANQRIVANHASPAQGGVTQFALPAIVAAMGAAEWLAAGGLGYLIANDAVNSASGDISYSFDEVEGVLLPGGGNDVAAHKTAHPNARIFEATHKFAIWAGTSGSRKMGIKFGITFLFDDAGAIGNISLSLIDVYDWPGFGGSFNVNITPRSLASGNASFRLTINVGTDHSWFVPEHPGSIQMILRGGDGDLSISVDNFYGYTEIS